MLRRIGPWRGLTGVLRVRRASTPPSAQRKPASSSMLPMRVEAWKYSSFAGGKDRPKHPEAETGRVPWGGVGAVGKWPVAATATSLAAAGHLSTAVVIADLR